MKKKIAITGAAGYIGRMLIESLAMRPEVEAIVAIDRAPITPLPPKTTCIAADIRDPRLVHHLTGCDTVVHLAFIVAAIHDLKETYDINVNGTRNLLAAVETMRPRKLVVASSVAAYGVQPRNGRRINEDTPLRGDASSYYNHTKRLCEEHCDVFAKRNPGIILTRLRPGILMGPRNKNFGKNFHRVPFIPLVREGACLPVVHEDDVIRAFTLAVDRDAPGAFIISLPEPAYITDFIPGSRKPRISIGIETLTDLVRALFTLRLIKFSPDWIVCARTEWRFDITRAREVLGWEPKHDLKSTIGDMNANMEAKQESHD